MKSINSRTHPLIKQIVALHDAKERKTHGQFIAEGLRVCTTLIQSGFEPAFVFVTDKYLDEARKIAADDTIILVPDQVMDKLSALTQQSGILGVFPMPQQPSKDTLEAGLVLAGITDPGNMGTLIRSSVAFGRKSIVCIGGVDPWSPKVIQSSAGTIASLALFQWSWQDLLAHKGSKKLAAMVVKDGINIKKADLHDSLLVVGSEAHGIPDEWVAQCDQKITLAMPGPAESLNAAVAGSIALYLAYC